jgi:hypothetical protein
MKPQWEIKRDLRDRTMRRALLEMLCEATKEERPGYPEFPEPVRDDEQVQEELRRILGIHKHWF